MHRRSAPMAPKEGRSSHSGTRSTAKQSVPKSHSSATARKSATTYSMNRVTGMLTSAADEQRQSWRATLRPILAIGLYFNIMVILCLIFVAIARSASHSRDTLIFKCESPPPLAKFERISVVSNSAVCNDLARTYVARNLSMFSIAFLMDLCLMSAEPHRSGFGGMSTAVFLESTNANCTVLDTFAVLVIDKNDYDDSCLAELRKKFSRKDDIFKMDRPGEAKLVLDLIERIPEDDFKTVKEKLEQLLRFKLPVSYALHNSIRAHATKLVMDPDSRWFFNSQEDYRPLAEGEFMQERPKWKETILKKLAKSSNLESFKKEMREAFEEFLYKCKPEDSGFSKVLGWPIKDDTNAYLFSPNSDERVCVAKELKIGTLRNEALNIFGEEKIHRLWSSLQRSGTRTCLLFSITRENRHSLMLDHLEANFTCIRSTWWQSDKYTILPTNVIHFATQASTA